MLNHFLAEMVITVSEELDASVEFLFYWLVLRRLDYQATLG